MTRKILLLVILISTLSCENINEAEKNEIWKLGWRMIENSWDKNFILAELQFDSLLSKNRQIDKAFLIEGLKIKVELSKEDEAVEIISTQSKEIIGKICEEQFAEHLKLCADNPKEKIENEELQLKIIKLFVDDQFVRGHVMKDIIEKYQIDSLQITQYDIGTTDEINRDSLKRFFEEFGFPTRKLIGKYGMNGIFFIIQHSDGDKEWQKMQLQNIELAVKRGDIDKERYAYLYDRVKLNNGELQRYGTQLNIHKENNIVQLRQTEDLINLNKRRREMGMMPIELYKKLTLKN